MPAVAIPAVPVPCQNDLIVRLFARIPDEFYLALPLQRFDGQTTQWTRRPPHDFLKGSQTAVPVSSSSKCMIHIGDHRIVIVKLKCSLAHGVFTVLAAAAVLVAHGTYIVLPIVANPAPVGDTRRCEFDTARIAAVTVPDSESCSSAVRNTITVLLAHIVYKVGRPQLEVLTFEA